MASGPEQEATGANSAVGNPTENDASTNNRADGSPPSPLLPLSCTKYFDAMWFCYSPVHQMQQYYRRGEFDNCFEKWNTLFDCLRLKTKKPSEVQEILETRERENARSHIWTFRTVEEASTHWRKVFGSMAFDRGGAGPSP